MSRTFWVGFALLLGCGPGKVEDPWGPVVAQDIEIVVGDAIHPRVLQEYDGLYDDADLAAYVQQVGNRVTTSVQKHYPRPYKYRFYILNSSMVNIFPLLGGNIYLTRGLLSCCANEDQLAGILSHALIHASARHTARRFSQLMTIDALAKRIQEGRHLVTEPWQQAATWREMDQATLALFTIVHAHQFEDEADTHGVRILYEAGYNPRGVVQIHEAIEKRLADKPRWTPFRNTHPFSKERLEACDRTIKQYYPDGDRREFAAARFEKAAARLKAEQEAYDHYDRGCEALDKGNFTEAIDLLTKAAELKKTEALFFRSRGLAYHRMQNYKQADQDLTEALARSTSNESIYIHRAQARIRMSRFQEAIGDLVWACRLVKRPRTFYWLGDCYERSRDPARAAQAYRNCIALAGYSLEEDLPSNAPEEIAMAKRRLSNLK
jgi:predicted Zn-dependent protease